MDIIYYPPHSNSNDYVNLVVKSIENNGYKVVNKQWNGDIKLILGSLYKSAFHKDVIFHFNWLEDNAAHSGVFTHIKCKLLLTFFKLFHVFGGRLVWTMHNAKSHNENIGYQEIFIRKMLKHVSLVIVHCSESKEILRQKYNYPEDKILFVPHGNYCTSMDRYLLEKTKQNDRIRYLYFGSISQYKGVEKLIEAFNSDLLNAKAELIVCGKVNDENVENRIRKLALKKENVKLNLRFITDEELGGYISSCDVVVLPYEKESMQNSGSAIMAISCGKPIIIPVFGYIKDIADQDFVFTYDYSNKDEQIAHLKEVLQRVCSINIKNPTAIKDAGRHARIYAEKELNWDDIGRAITYYYVR